MHEFISFIAGCFVGGAPGYLFGGVVQADFQKRLKELEAEFERLKAKL